MRSLSASLTFRYSWRLTLFCLLATYVLLQPLPLRVHSANQLPQSFAPEINTGALTTAREGHTATLLQNGKVLVAGGRSGGTIHNTAEVYDPLTAMWTPTGNTLNSARYGHSAVLLRSGQVLVVGGQGSSGFLDTAEIYDPADNSWKLLSRLNAPRFHATATLLNNGRVLVAGGMNSSGALRSAESYDPTTRIWTRLAVGNNAAGNLIEARAEHTAALLNDGRVLLAGGVNGSMVLRSAELFEPNLNRFRRVGDLQAPRRLHTATLLPDGAVLATGGLNGATVLGSSETYNPATGAWTMSSGGLTARRSHTATLLPNGRVLLLGGKNSAGATLNSAELYNSQARTWSNALLPYTTSNFALNTARSDHTATLLRHGQVLIAGGLDGGNAATTAAELYEYAAGFWSLTKNTAGTTTQMNFARLDHTATLLPNGKVLVAGGYALTNIAATLSTCELYDPATGAWAVTGSLNVARSGHTATLLPNGKVLVVGGYLFNPNGSIAGTASSAELYDPVTGSWTPAADSGVFRFRHTATLLANGRVFVVGGSTSSVQLYNPANDTWADVAALAPARNNHSATLLPNGNVFVFGGLSADARNVFNSGALFNATSNTWTALTFSNPTPAFRLSHKATLLPNGRVFISGGYGGLNTADVGNVVGFAEVYNLATNRFEAGRVTLGSRVDHSATLLPNGKLLLVGGLTVSQNFSNCPYPPSTPQALLFDSSLPLGATAVTELYEQFAPLQTRNAHTATLLANGKVLIAGGQAGEMLPQCLNPDFIPTSLRHTELYDLGLGYNDSWRPTITHFSAPGATNAAEFAAPEQTAIVANGVQFQGISEAAGHGASSAATNYPLAQLRSLLNEQLASVPVNAASGGWTNNSYAYTTPAGFPAGPALLTIFANGIPSIARVVAAPGGDLVPTNASPTGTISGRVIMHNGVGLAATVTMTPTAGSPTGCSSPRTVTTGPNGEFTFDGVVISPRPQIDCSGNRNLVCTNSTANGCNVTYTPPTASPAGTTVTCVPNSGAFFPLGTTNVNCTATNATGSSSCSFPVTIVPFTLTCPPNSVTNITGGNGVNVNYPAPTANVGGSTVRCTPPSGSFFPVGTTTVNCSATNPATTAVATCSFTVTVRAQGLSLTCPANITTSTSNEGGVQVNYPPPTPSISGTPSTCNPPSGSRFPIGTTVVTCQASTAGATATCRFNITVNFSGQTFRQSLDQPTPSAVAVIALNNVNNEPARAPAAPEQNQTNCRYEVRPAATVGTQPIGFFPAAATFNMIEDRGSTASAHSGQLNFAAPEQTGGTTCQYCTGNKFVSQTPFWNIAGRIQTPGGAGVTDVNLEFAVPYEICDDRLTCQITAENPSGRCDVTGAITVTGDPCAKASTNLLDPAAAFHCACTTLRGDGSCEKTVLARFPGLPALRPPFEPAGNGSFDWRTPLFQIQPNGNYNIANVPNGANAVVTPNNRPGGTQYSFSYLPVAPPSGVIQSFVQIDQITRSYDQQIITAEAACVAPTITAQPANQTVCAGSPATFSVTASGTGLSYQWRKNGVNIGGATASSFTLPAVTAGDAAQYDVVVMSACGNLTSNAVSLTVNSLTVITAQPTNQAACPGGSANFTVGATGTGLSYQWRKAGVNIAGATASSITIAAVTAGDAASYDVVVSGACGAVTSNAATLTLNSATTITAQPANQVACSGAPATFSVGASGAGAVSYQWRKDGANIGGATASSFTLAAVTAGDAGGYDVVVSSSCGTVTSAAATLTVNPATAISAQPVNQIVCAGAPATFTVAATGAGLSYQWRKGGANISGATGNSYTLPAAAAEDAGSYDVVVTGACGSVTSTVATLTVNALTAISAQPAHQTVCAGGAATFTVAATGAGLSYQWRKAGANIPGANGNSYTLAAVSANDAGQYDVVVSGACGSVTSAAATLTINPATTINLHPLNQAVCPGGSATFSVAASGAGTLSYQWRKGGVAIGGATASSFTINNVAAGDAGGYDVAVTGDCGTVSSNLATLTVSALPDVPTISAPTAVCANSANNQASGPAGASGYEWTITNGTITGGTAAQTVTYTAGATGNVTLTLRITNAAACSASNSLSIPINTVPSVTTQPVNQTVCENGTVTFTAAANNAASVQWQVSTDAGANFNNVPGATSTTLSFSASAAQQGALYRVVFANACGAVNSSVALLNVTLLPTIATQPTNRTVCDNSPVTFTAAANNSASVQWQVSTDGGANFNDVPGATNATLSLTASLGQNGAHYRAAFTNSCGTVTSNAATLTVTPLLSIGTQPANQAACVGAAVTFNVAANGTAPLTYQWRKNGAPINGATNSSFTLNAAAPGDAAQYDVIIISGCGTATSNVATLTVNAFALAAANAAFQATGGTNSVDLTATVGQCTWNATSNDSWLSITSVTSTGGTAPGSGTGNGRVNYSVAANTGPTARTGTMTIAGLNFTVTQSGQVPAPRLDTLSQTSALAGGAGFTLTATGANFTNTSVLRWNGSARMTNVASATQLTAQITATDLATAGAFTIDVFDPPPGGGASNTLSFTVVQPNPVPQIANLSPSTREAGGGQFMLTVNGSGFINGSVVRWNNNDRSTSFVSATQLTAVIPATDVATAGTANVTVFNPAPGGGTSGSVSFNITAQQNPVPVLTALAPNSATAGDAAFTLTVTGSNFVNGSVVRWNNAARNTTFVSATQLTAAIPASDIATASTATITVFNPAPGGGTSGGQSFTINQAPPPPMFSSMSPNTAVAGGQGFMLTINGSGFSSGTVVRWNGSARPTTVTSGTSLTATIPASDIAQPGINQVTVFTPPPGGGTVTAITFVVGTLAVNVSAASFVRERGVANGIMTVFGVELATGSASATTVPLPTTLAGTTIKVRDSFGTERDAPLFFVSPGQSNYLLPQGTAPGAATAIITSGANKISVGALDVQTVAPALFTANANGQGVPAGLLLRVKSDNQQSFEPLAQIQDGRFVPRPLDLGPEGDRVFLVLFGTGMRALTAQTNASATLGGINLPLAFIGAQGELVGVDQVNLGPLPRSLAGRGNVDLVLTVEGRAANTVQLNIR